MHKKKEHMKKMEKEHHEGHKKGGKMAVKAKVAHKDKKK